MKEELLTGIYSGIIATFLWTIIAGLFFIVWRKIIEPQIKEWLYNGPDVKGNWNGEGSRAESTNYVRYEASILLTQSASSLNGSLTVRNFAEDESINISYYKVTGVIENDNLALIYQRDNRKKTGIGSVLLKIANGGNGLKGRIMYIDSDNKEVRTVEDVLFIRTKS